MRGKSSLRLPFALMVAAHVCGGGVAACRWRAPAGCRWQQPAPPGCFCPAPSSAPGCRRAPSSGRERQPAALRLRGGGRVPSSLQRARRKEAMEQVRPSVLKFGCGRLAVSPAPSLREVRADRASNWQEHVAAPTPAHQERYSPCILLSIDQCLLSCVYFIKCAYCRRASSEGGPGRRFGARRGNAQVTVAFVCLPRDLASHAPSHKMLGDAMQDAPRPCNLNELFCDLCTACSRPPRPAVRACPSILREQGGGGRRGVDAGNLSPNWRESPPIRGNWPPFPTCCPFYRIHLTCARPTSYRGSRSSSTWVG